MKFVYCLKCKMPIEIVRKALPKYSKVIDAIEPHTCQTENAEWQFPINPAPTVTIPPPNPNDEIVKILNDLDAGLSDRRPKDQVREDSSNSAPQSILKQIRGQND